VHIFEQKTAEQVACLFCRDDQGLGAQKKFSLDYWLRCTATDWKASFTGPLLSSLTQPLKISFSSEFIEIRVYIIGIWLYMARSHP